MKLEDKDSKINSLSDKSLLLAVELSANRELEACSLFLRCLAELDKRKLYLGLGYSSSYDYLTRKLRYSEGAALRRITCARVVAKFPGVIKLLAARKITLTTLSMVAKLLTAQNCLELLAKIENKSKRDVELLLAQAGAPQKVLDLIKPVGKALGTALRETEMLRTKTAHDLIEVNQNTQPFTDPGIGKKDSIPNNIETPLHGAPTGANPDCKKSPTITPALKALKTQVSYKIQFGANGAFIEKLDQVRAILSRKYPASLDLNTIFNELLVNYLEHNCAKAREVRRAKRGKTARLNPKNQQVAPSKAKIITRHIPQAIRDKVYIRDKGQCTFISPDGVQCSSTHNLHFDHVEPFMLGGKHELENLRLLCAAHNAHLARLSYPNYRFG